MRKTISLGLSIILCLVGSLVLLSLIEVEQVVKAAPPKTTTTYNVAFVSDGSGVAIDDITKASPAVVTTGTAHGLTNGDEVHITSVLGMTQVNDRNFTVTVSDAVTFSLIGEDSTSHTTYTSGGIAGLPACTDTASPSAAACSGLSNDPTCQVLATRTLNNAGVPRTQEIEDDNTSYQVRFGGAPLNASDFFNGVTLCDEANTVLRVIVKSCVWNHQAATSSSRTPLINFTFSMISPRWR